MGPLWKASRETGLGWGVTSTVGKTWIPVQSQAPSYWGLEARPLRAPRHLFCSHLAGQGAWYMVWTSRA